MNNLELTYKLTKSLINVRSELTEWARLSREGKLNDFHEKNMIKHAFKIDELLKEVGVEWIKDYEENMKIRNNMQFNDY